LGFGGGGVSKLTAHTHNAGLAGDGGDLSETLTDMNGVALYSLITDNAAAVAANTADIATNTAAIAAIGEVPSGAVIIWTNSIASIPAGYTFYEDIPSTESQTVANEGRGLGIGAPRTQLGQQFNTGSTIIGRKPAKVSWYMYKNGSPTGTINAYITNSSGVTRETSTTSLDSSTLPTDSENAAFQEFNFAGTTAIVAGDMITIVFNGGSAGNTVNAMSNNLAVVSNQIFRQYTTSWQDIAGEAATNIVEWNFAYILKS
jgi:hypothetical protein